MCAALGLAGALWPAASKAEVGAGASPTSQAVAADAQFLEYAPPPPQPGVVCLVDSGVDPNPDTQAAVIGAEAEVPAWGTGDGLAQTQAPVEGHPDGHGTEMAMMMAAPQNGWGMVGIAPTSVRVYSVRVVPPGVTGFPFSAYSYGISRCIQLQLRTQAAISVINLSLAEVTTPSQDDLAELEDTVDTARQRGIDVVAAAGNGAGAVPYYPAAYPSVLAVGASDAGAGNVGALCNFSGSLGLQVVAPGCNTVTGGVDESFQDDGAPALGFGTSQAAAVTSTVLAAMRAYAPNLTDWQAEMCLKGSERNGENIDAAAAFSACGLGPVVQAGLANSPRTVPMPPSVPTPPSGPVGGPASITTPPVASAPLVAPLLGRLAVRAGKLVVKVLNRPHAVSIQVRVLAPRHGRLVVIGSRTTLSSKVTFTVKLAKAVAARFVTHEAVGRTSTWVTQKVT